MDVDDGVGFVGAAGRLIDALAEQSDGARIVDEQVVEGLQISGCDLADPGHIRHRNGLPEPRRYGNLVGKRPAIEPPAGLHLIEQPVEQRSVGIGRDGEVQVGAMRGFGGARVDDDQPGTMRRPGCLDALPDYRMAPGGVRPYQDDKVRRIKVVIAARHHVLAERPHMGSNGAGHAQPRIRVDVGGADEALHKLVGDVIVFGQHLARGVEGDAVRAVFGGDGDKTLGNQVQRFGPLDRLGTDHRLQQPPLQPDRLAQMRALGA